MEEFQCFVCLDLIYKPVVLECGHVSCFWCVHKSMSGLRDSSCAVCRRPYNFFPGICELLHNLLWKLEPAAYKLREAEILEEEKSAGFFSPQFVGNSANGNQEKSSSLSHCEASEETEVSISDVLCSGCRDLLFRPVVLNCGHVFCEPCVPGVVGEKRSCSTCGDLHPGGLPKIFLELDHFVERKFPIEYAKRKASLKPELIKSHAGSSSSALPSDKLCKNVKKKFIQLQTALKLPMFDEDLLYVHVGVGCDACGMYPISGKRYKCKDCKESIGFDLCEACYDTPSKRPGRFNQQHTADHQLVLDDSNLLGNILKEKLKDELGEAYYNEPDEDRMR